MTFDEWIADKPSFDHGTAEWMREAWNAATMIEREACANECSTKICGSKGFLDELPTLKTIDESLLVGYSKEQASSAFAWLQEFAAKESSPIEASLALIFWSAAVTACTENVRKP